MAKRTPEELKAFRVENLRRGREQAKARKKEAALAVAKDIEGTALPTREPDPPSAPIQAKTAEEIRQEATVLADALVKDPDHFGRGGKTDAPLEPAQADHLPGTKPTDTLYLPERVVEVGSTHSRQCTLPNDYKYAWVLDTLEHSKVMTYKGMGYKICLYAGGGLSGLADRGFTNSDMFDNDRGRVRHGDLLLMWIEHRGWKALAEEEKKLLESWNTAATENIHNIGYRHGVRTFVEEDGKQVF